MKLQGLKVLDLSAFLPGPHLTMMMADHGADVVMVEPANGVGEPTRNIGYRTSDNVSVWFRNIARGKKSLKINLKDPEGLKLFLRLASDCDVMLEAFRPGVVTRLGIGYETLSETNPGIVYCSISAFGQDGPYRDKPAHDLTIQALAGTASLNLGLEDGKPALPNIPSADAISSLMAMSAILMALYRRQKTGQGDYIDLAMYDALLAWTPNVSGPVFAEDSHPQPKSMRSFGGAAMYNIYQTIDEQYIVLGGSELKFAKNLLTALDRVDLLHYAQLEPGPEQQPLKDFFSQIFKTRSREHWETFFEHVDCCWAAVRSLKDAFDDPHTMARQMRLKDKNGQHHVGIPIKYNHEPGQADLTLADYGQHSVQLAEAAGYEPDLINELKRRGVI